MASERMTSIRLPGLDNWIGGSAEYGLVSKEAMIAAHRLRAEKARRDAQAILDASDEDFLIATYRGIHARRDYRVIQRGKQETQP